MVLFVRTYGVVCIRSTLCSDSTLFRAESAAHELGGAGPDFRDMSPWPRSRLFSSLEKLLVSTRCTACQHAANAEPSKRSKRHYHLAAHSINLALILDETTEVWLNPCQQQPSHSECRGRPSGRPAVKYPGCCSSSDVLGASLLHCNPTKVHQELMRGRSLAWGGYAP